MGLEAATHLDGSARQRLSRGDSRKVFIPAIHVSGEIHLGLGYGILVRDAVLLFSMAGGDFSDAFLEVTLT